MAGSLRGVLAAAVVAAFAAPAAAGKFNPALSVGDPAPAFAGLKGIDGHAHDSAEWNDARAVVVVVTGNTCPYANDVEDRLVGLAKKYADRPVKVVAVNANAGDADSLDAMKARATERGFDFPYLKDDVGALGKALGATRTPEFFVFGPDRKVVYMGTIDDDPEGKRVTKRYVEDAVEAALAGETPAVAETAPVGCLVKYPREKRP